MNAESIEVINQLLHTSWVKDIHFLKGSSDDPWLKIDLVDEQFKDQLSEKTKRIKINMIITVPDKDGRAAQELAELINYHAAIHSELPELLAKLANADRKEEALDLLIQWGTHAKPNSEIWKEARELLRGENSDLVKEDQY